MKWRNISLFILVLILAFSGCRKDFDFPSASEGFRFSRDTVYLDTVFTTVRSETYSVKIYNQQSEDVLIPEIYLEDGINSYYRINVDGNPGVSFRDVALRANDSIFVFVEIAPTAAIPNQTLVVENLKVVNTSGSQEVKLVSLVEDAEFFYPQPGESEVVLNADTEWNNDKSKVIFGNLRVAPGASLTVNEGTHVYFHKKSSLIVDSNAELNVSGQLEQEVEFRGDRHDLRHDTLPANWQGIQLYPGSVANINYAKINGGFSALEGYQTTLNISNCKINNFVNVGIFAIDSEINAYNLLMNNFGDADVALGAGGDYKFEQCTFANYFDLGAGNAYSIYLSDNYEDGNGNSVSGNFTQALFGNCIFYNDGLNSFETSGATNYLFDHCLFKYGNTNSGFNPETDSRFQDCFFNEDPLFLDTRASVNNLSLKDDSFARNKGASIYATNHPLDYYGNTRSSTPTLGALE